MAELLYSRTKTIQEDKVSGFCPGCMHSTVMKLIGEVIDESRLGRLIVIRCYHQNTVSARVSRSVRHISPVGAAEHRRGRKSPVMQHEQ